MAVHNSSISVVPTVEGTYVPKPVVFCDFDGPIVDVSERYYQTYRTGLLAIEGLCAQGTSTADAGQPSPLQPLSKAQFWQMKQSRVADIEIALRSGLPSECFAPFMQQVERIVNHPSLLRWDRLQPGAREAMAYIKQAGMRLVLVTLRHPKQVNEFLQAQQLSHLIDEVYGIADVRAAHANRVEQKCELLSEAIAQQQTQGHFTQSSWMVGDTEADIVAGQTAGLSTSALSCGVRSQAYLQHLGPTRVHPCLLSAAHEVVNASVLQAA